MKVKSESRSIILDSNANYIGQWCPQFMLYALSSHCPLRNDEQPVKRFRGVTILRIEVGAHEQDTGLPISEMQATTDEVLVINGAKLSNVPYEDRYNEYKWTKTNKSSERYYALLRTEGSYLDPPSAIIQRVSKEEAFEFLLYRHRGKMRIWKRAKAEVLRKIQQNKKENVMICKTDPFITLVPPNDVFVELVNYENSGVYHVKRNAFFLRKTDEFFFRVTKEAGQWIKQIEYLDPSIAAVLIGPSLSGHR